MKKLSLVFVLLLLLTACTQARTDAPTTAPTEQSQVHEPSVLPGEGEDFLVGMEVKNQPTGAPK